MTGVNLLITSDAKHGGENLGKSKIVRGDIKSPPQQGSSWEGRQEGFDQGLISAWIVGIDKSRTDIALSIKAKAGELPRLPWKGGLDKPIKAKGKIGALHYLAAWQGLRGEDLHIDLAAEVQLTCTSTNVLVTFTGDITKLLLAGEGD